MRHRNKILYLFRKQDQETGDAYPSIREVSAIYGSVITLIEETSNYSQSFETLIMWKAVAHTRIPIENDELWLRIDEREMPTPLSSQL